MPNTERPRAIIFDWDNTLVDSWPPIQDALNTTLTTFGHQPWTMQETRQRVRKSLRDTFPGLFGDKWEDAADVFYGRYEEIHAKEVTAFSGSQAMLADLSEIGIYLGVVSNKRGDFLRKEASSLKWDRYFGQIIGANDAPKDKPATDPVHMALSGADLVLNDTIWFVGDADIDLECAVNADCVPVLMRPDPPDTGEFSTHKPHFYFENAEALCNHVRNL